MDESFTLSGLDESFAEKSCPGIEHECDICNNKTVHKSNLARHKKTHLEADLPEPEHQLCNECGKSFDSRYGQSLHIKGVHQKQYKYECLVCQKKTNCLRNHRGHVAKHEPTLKEKCRTCQATFQYRKSLVRHNCKGQTQTSVTPRRKIIKCDQCETQFASNYSRKDHIRAVHGHRRLPGLNGDLKFDKLKWCFQ